eukprot:15344157-Ditylum_brightwellii.AAC.1
MFSWGSWGWWNNNQRCKEEWEDSVGGMNNIQNFTNETDITRLTNEARKQGRNDGKIRHQKRLAAQRLKEYKQEQGRCQRECAYKHRIKRIQEDACTTKKLKTT